MPYSGEVCVRERGVGLPASLTYLDDITRVILSEIIREPKGSMPCIATGDAFDAGKIPPRTYVDKPVFVQ